MATSTPANVVPQAIRRKLSAVRQREARLTFLAGAAAAAAAFLVAMLAAMSLDWLITPFHPALRLLLTLAALAVGGGLCFLWAIRPLLRRRSLPEVAQLVDESVPRLEERWSTVADLSQSTDRPEMRGAPALIRAVTWEAEELSDLVEPKQVVSPRSVKKGLIVCAGVLAGLALGFLWDGPQVGVLLQRFWRPGAPLSLTRVVAMTGDVVVPQSESLDIAAKLERRLRDTAELSLRSADGTVAHIPMLALNAERGEFTTRVEKIEKPFEYRVRSGDGQTPWHRVEVAERPQLTLIDFALSPPAYSKLPPQKQQGLPRRAKALEGSTLELLFESRAALRDFALVLGGDREQTLEPEAGNRYRFRTVLKENMSLSPLLTSVEGLQNENPPVCQIAVFPDRYPTVSVTSPGDELVVRPDDKLKVEFTAKDDFGIARAELVVTDESAGQSRELQVIDIPLGDQEGTSSVAGAVELDLKQLGAKQGAELSYAVRVFDTKQSSAESGPGASPPEKPSGSESTANDDGEPANRPPADNAAPRNDTQPPAAESAASQAATAQAAAAAPSPTSASLAGQSSPAQAASAQSEAANSPEAQPPAEQAPAAQTADNRPPDKETPSDQRTADASGGGSGRGAARAKPKEDEEDRPKPEGAQRPGDSMSRRLLDIGQCTTCKARQLKVDEWAGSFAGQMRKKLELAIDDYLKRLDAALAAAEQSTFGLARQLTAQPAWDDEQAKTLRAASAQLGTAQQVVVELSGQSQGTPYAFMGLQLAEISELHITPAAGHLRTAAEAEQGSKLAELTHGVFHIQRARELLAKLTRTYEGVKINHQLAEEMIRVKKMHQIFIEDTLALLGSSRPVLNPKQRKFLEFEVDEEYLKKLKELLERKREIQAELAKVLAKDPRLLQRFMAKSRLEADSLRDQLTLLARREQTLQEEVTRLNAAGTDPEKIAAAVKPMRARDERDVVEISEAAAKIYENYVAWTPLDLDPNAADLAKVREQLSQLATASGAVAVELADGKTDAALEKARGLHERLQELQQSLPALAEAHPDHNQLLTHVANRLAENAKLLTLTSGWIRKLEVVAKGEHHLAAHVDQSRITDETAELTNKVANLQSWLAGLSPEIGETAKRLNEILADDLLVIETAAERFLEAGDFATAGKEQADAVKSFAQAEKQFDELLEKVIAHLDAIPVDTSPSGDGLRAETLDELLALLQDEKLATEGLGIPCCRPSNISIVRDWMKPGESGAGIGGMMAAGAQAQAKLGQQKAEKMRRAAEGAERRLTAAAEAMQAARNRARGVPTAPRWNTLQSRLEDGLRQVRGQTPPERYRLPIERYFEAISEKEKTPGLDAAADKNE